MIIQCLAAFLIAGLMTGCASTPLSSSQQQELIGHLQIAKMQDQQNAAASPDPAEAQDSLQAAAHADRAIREIEHGFAVSPDELQEAFNVPPKVITRADKLQFIKMLTEAKQEDENRLEATFHEGPDRDAYAEREDEVDEVIRDLEIGGDVPWSRIRGALRIPYKP